MYNKKIMITFLLIQGILSVAHAQQPMRYLNAGAGINIGNAGENNTIPMNSLETKGFTVPNNTNTNATFTFGGGYEWQMSSPVNIALGLAGYYRDLGTVSGLVHPLVNVAPNFDVLNFTYDAQSIALMAEARLKWRTASHWQPYILLGAGESWNQLSDYAEVTPSGSTTAPMPAPFRSNTQSHFAYELGLGVSYRVNTVGVSLEYSYANLGQASLGTSPAQTTSNTIQAGTLKSQGIMVTVTQYI